MKTSVEILTGSHQNPPGGQEAQSTAKPHSCGSAVRLAMAEKRIEELERCYAQTLDNYMVLCKRLRKMERRWALLHEASHPGRTGD